MKLLNFSFTKPRYWVLGLAAAAGASTAQAQYTGIGTTAPGATLHVVPAGATAQTFAATDEVFAVQGVKDLATTEKSAYAEVLVYDNTTGLFRREAIADLLDDNSEWVWDGTTLAPRRSGTGEAIADEIGIADGTVGIGNDLTVGGDAAVTGDATVTADLTVDGNTVLATGTTGFVSMENLTRVGTGATGVPAASQVLLRNATNDQVEYAQLDDLIEDNGMWVENAAKTELLPRVSTYEGTIGITAATVDVKKNLNVAEATTLDSSLTVEGRVFFEDIDERASPVTGTDEVLIQQSGSDLVEYVTVGDLLQDNGEWRFEAASGTTPDHIYANRADAAGNEIVATSGGSFGIGTTNPSDALQVVGGGIDLDGDQGVSFGAIGAIAGDGTNVELTSTGSVDVASAGVTTIASGGGTLVTVNAEGLGIGVVAATDRVLQTNTADGIQFGNLIVVANTETNLGPATPADASDDFRNVVLTDDDGVLRVIDIDDLLSDSGEWVYEDNGAAGVTSDDRIYVRRLDATAATDDAVYVDGVGNVVVDETKAYQWGSAADQISATGLTVDNGYTFTTQDDADVSFTEDGGAQPWLFFDGADGGTGTGAYQGRVGIGTNTPSAALHVVGNMVASHTAQTSDERFKRDINELHGALDAVEAMRGVSYAFRAKEFPQENFDDATHIGFIAQELREILPQAVFERNDGYLTVDYAAVTPVLVEAVQELSDRVESLEAENAALREGNTGQAVGAVSTKQLQELEARLAAMDARLEAATTGRK